MPAPGPLVESFYEAALDPDAWEQALSALARAFDARSCHFWALEAASGRPLFSYLAGDNDPASNQLYLAHYAAIDPRLRIKAPPGAIVACHRYLDEQFVAKDETYQEFLIPRGYRFVAGTRLRIAGDDTQAVLGLNRAAVQGPFEAKTVRLLRERYLPHLARAARVHYALLQARQHDAVVTDIIDRLQFAVIVVDRTCRVLLANSTAERLLRQDDAVATRNGRLVAPHPGNGDALARLVASPDGGECAICRPPPGKPLLATALPLAPVAAAGMGHPAAAVALFITETRRALPQQWLERRFGLTPAEARLAVNLAAGKTLASIAAEYTIAENTLRVQVQSLFRKTGVARQAELVSMLLALPPVVPPQAGG